MRVFVQIATEKGASPMPKRRMINLDKALEIVLFLKKRITGTAVISFKSAEIRREKP